MFKLDFCSPVEVASLALETADPEVKLTARLSMMPPGVIRKKKRKCYSWSGLVRRAQGLDTSCDIPLPFPR